MSENTLLPIRLGIDVGSTTVKVAVLDDDDKLIYGDYQRHRADIRSTIINVVNKALDFLEKNIEGGAARTITAKVTGSKNDVEKAYRAISADRPDIFYVSGFVYDGAGLRTGYRNQKRGRYGRLFKGWTVLCACAGHP